MSRKTTEIDWTHKPIAERVAGMCVIVGCPNPVRKRGLCTRHISAANRRGNFSEVALPSTRTAPPPSPSRSVEAAVSQREGEPGSGFALEGELRRYREHLDDIRCDILDAGVPLGDDTDPELTPRRLVGELLVARRELAAVGGVVFLLLPDTDTGSPVAPRLADVVRDAISGLRMRLQDAETRAGAESKRRAEAEDTLSMARAAARDVNSPTLDVEQTIRHLAGCLSAALVREREQLDRLAASPRQRGLLDGVARALGYTDGAGDSSDEDLLEELRKRLDGEASPTVPLLTEPKLRELAADYGSRVTRLDEIAARRLALEQEAAAVLGGAA